MFPLFAFVFDIGGYAALIAAGGLIVGALWVIRAAQRFGAKYGDKHNLPIEVGVPVGIAGAALLGAWIFGLNLWISTGCLALPAAFTLYVRYKNKARKHTIPPAAPQQGDGTKPP